MRPLLLAASFLLLAMPASAQFEVLPGTASTTPSPGNINAADYSWTPLTLASCRVPEQPTAMLVVDQGSPKDPSLGRATRVRLVTLKDHALVLDGPAFLTQGSFEHLDSFDLTGDGIPEILLRCRIETPSTDLAKTPFSGRPPSPDATPPMLITSVVQLATSDAAPTLLLSYPTPVGADETWGRLPTSDGGNDLVIASFGGHAAGSTASPDAYLHFHYSTDGTGPHLERLADLVLPPVPIDQLITTPLADGAAPVVVTLRHIAQAKYQQQLWAQRLNPQGFFDNAPIGQGNDLLLLGPDPAVPGVQFFWHDPSTVPSTTHLSSLTLNDAGKPQTQSDSLFPFNARLLASVPGKFIPYDTGDAHCRALLLETPDQKDRWLGLVEFGSDGKFQRIELHHPADLDQARHLAAFDVDGDGTDEIVWLTDQGLEAYSAITRALTGPLDLKPSSDGRSDTFTLAPD